MFIFFACLLILQNSIIYSAQKVPSHLTPQSALNQQRPNNPTSYLLADMQQQQPSTPPTYQVDIPLYTSPIQPPSPSSENTRNNMCVKITGGFMVSIAIMALIGYFIQESLSDYAR